MGLWPSAGGQGSWVGEKWGPQEPLSTAPSLLLHPGTEFEYTDSESEVKVRKRSPAGLLRPKKGLGEPGPSLAVSTSVPSTHGPGPTSPDKAKLAVEKGRKARKLRGPKEPGFEAGPEASDDDLWTRRRSERIFLHDASAAAPAPSSAAPVVAKPGRCSKGGPLSPRKDAGRAKDRKDPRKVGLVLGWRQWEGLWTRSLGWWLRWLPPARPLGSHWGGCADLAPGRVCPTYLTEVLCLLSQENIPKMLWMLRTPKETVILRVPKPPFAMQCSAHPTWML